MAAPDDILMESDEPVSSLFVVAPAGLATIKKRADFLASAKGLKARSSSFLIQLKPGSAEGLLRFGFTVTNKCGNAPERNRMRRRLRAAIRTLLPEISGGGDFVIVARRELLALPQQRLLDDLKRSLSWLKRKASAPADEKYKASASAQEK